MPPDPVYVKRTYAHCYSHPTCCLSPPSNSALEAPLTPPEAAEGTWGWEGTDDGACVSTCTLRGSGGISPRKISKISCSEIASEAIFVLKSGQFLPWTCLALLCDKIIQGSLSHYCTYSGTKGQILTIWGARAPGAPPPSSGPITWEFDVSFPLT